MLATLPVALLCSLCIRDCPFLVCAFFLLNGQFSDREEREILVDSSANFNFVANYVIVFVSDDLELVTFFRKA